MNHATRAVLFDLDGTLVDSAPDIAAAINAALSTASLGPLCVTAITPMLGAGARAAVERALAACGNLPSPGLADEVHAAYIAAYEATPCAHTLPYRGAPEVLDSLIRTGWKLGVVTNKPQQIARQVLDILGLTHRFDVVVGAQDGTPLKPDPAMIFIALKALGVPPLQAIFVGDSKADVGAARAARLRVILLSHGYTALPARELGADAVIDHFDELTEAIARVSSIP